MTNLARCNFLLILISFLPIRAFAQTKLAPTNINVIMEQMQQISISQPSVDIYVNQLQLFGTGVSSALQINHIKIGSTTSYQVSVRSLSSFFSRNGRNTSIPVHAIQLQTNIGDDLTGNNIPASANTFIFSNVPLSIYNSLLITNADPEAGRGYDVIYKIPANNMAHFINQREGTYTTTLIYTLTAL
jgi:hypothetical protein